MKCCTKCKEKKNEEEFSFRKDRNVYATECKKCIAKRAIEHYYKNKEKANEKRKKHYEENKEKTLEKCKYYYAENRERIRQRANARRKTPEERAKINAASKKWAKENKERHQQNTTNWKRKNPKKALAHQYVLWGIRLKVLQKPEACEVCKEKGKLDAHHKDYEKPLEVQWVCRLCHMHLHEKMLDVRKGIKDDSNSIGQHFSSD